MVYNICLTSKAPYKACSAFTHVAACTLALSPIRDTLSEGFSHFVTSMTAPVASGWSGRRVGLAPPGERRLVTAHTPNRLYLCIAAVETMLIGVGWRPVAVPRRTDRPE